MPFEAGKTLDGLRIGVGVSGSRSTDAACPPVAGGSPTAIGASDRYLAAIVESMETAVVSIDRDHVVTVWNAGAARLFGYAPDAVLGRPYGFLVPPEHRDEEADLIRAALDHGTCGEMLADWIRSDGTRIQVAVSVAPVRDRRGAIIGVSLAAGARTEQVRAIEGRDLVIAEMNHRIKNLFLLAGGMVQIGARSAKSVKALAGDVSQRLEALAQAHSLALPSHQLPNGRAPPVSLHSLLATILLPFACSGPASSQRISISGRDVQVSGDVPLNGLALLFYELATNAVKHGALAGTAGRIRIRTGVRKARVNLRWSEEGGRPGPKRTPGGTPGGGFGAKLVELTVSRQLNARLSRKWRDDGLEIRLSVALGNLMEPAMAHAVGARRL